MLVLFWYALLCVLSSFANILMREIQLFALLLLSFECLVTVDDLWLFLTVPWVGLLCVIVVFPDHTHYIFSYRNVNSSFVFLNNSLLSQSEQNMQQAHSFFMFMLAQ